MKPPAATSRSRTTASLDTLEGFLEAAGSGSVAKADLESALEAVNVIRVALGHESRESLTEQNAGMTGYDYAMGEILRTPRTGSALTQDPIFIVGYRRSGTTLLSWLLDSHPEIASVPENTLCWSILSQTDRGLPFAPMHNLAAVLGEPHGVFLDRISLLVDSVFGDYAKRKGKRRWVDKEVHLSMALDDLDRLFNYRAKFIYIVRHGLDAAFSAAERFGIRGEVLRNRRSGLAIENYLHEWRENNENTHGFYRRNSGSCLLVKYEDLVANPAEIGRKMFEFLGFPWSDEILVTMRNSPHSPYLGDNKILFSGGAIDPSRSNRWTHWPKPLLGYLASIANPTLVRLGYSPVSIE